MEAMSSLKIQLALWILQPPLLVATAVVLFHRKLHKQFPAFFAFIIVQIASFVSAFSVRHNSSLYSYMFCFWAAVNAVFAFSIIYEIFLDVFRPYPALRDLGSALFKWAAMVMILVSVVTIALSPNWDNPVERTILIVQRCIDIAQFGLVIFLLAFCRKLGVTWRRRSFGVALGFGLYSGVELVILALHAGTHIHGMLASTIAMGADDVSVLLWLGYSLLEQREASVGVLVPQRWDDALTEIQPREEGESLIPMFEHMVDRALAKTQDQRV
jgi:hypothetical protein